MGGGGKKKLRPEVQWGRRSKTQEERQMLPSEAPFQTPAKKQPVQTSHITFYQGNLKKRHRCAKCVTRDILFKYSLSLEEQCYFCLHPHVFLRHLQIEKSFTMCFDLSFCHRTRHFFFFFFFLAIAQELERTALKLIELSIGPSPASVWPQSDGTHGCFDTRT